jgi:hypothetical protein
MRGQSRGAAVEGPLSGTALWQTDFQHTRLKGSGIGLNDDIALSV